jgi:hypothetical protein
MKFPEHPISTAMICRLATAILTLSIMSVHAGLNKLEAISMIESGNNDRAIGRAGEVSRYQIKPEIWHQYTESKDYHDPQVAASVAAQHLEQLETAFRAQAGREPTDFDRYVMWNGGLTYYAHLKFAARAVASVIRERANRYVNLREAASLSSPSLAALDLKTPAFGR